MFGCWERIFCALVQQRRWGVVRHNQVCSPWKPFAPSPQPSPTHPMGTVVFSAHLVCRWSWWGLDLTPLSSPTWTSVVDFLGSILIFHSHECFMCVILGGKEDKVQFITLPPRVNIVTLWDISFGSSWYKCIPAHAQFFLNKNCIKMYIL